MAELIVNPKCTFLTPISGSYKRLITRASSAPREILVLGVILGVLQVLDAVLTAVGVNHFGSHMEANPIIRTLIIQIGYIPALAVVKCFAIAVIVALCGLASAVPWLAKAMKVVIGIYIGAAIIPWTAVILTRII